MKKILLYIPIVLSLIVLGAHFMRYGNSVGVIGAVFLIALLFLRHPWVARTMQVVLTLGALEWVHTVYKIAQVRSMLGEPYMRMVLILGTVAAVALLSAWLFQTKTLRGIYRLDRDVPKAGVNDEE
jgi:hypothetical protein